MPGETKKRPPTPEARAKCPTTSTSGISKSHGKQGGLWLVECGSMALKEGKGQAHFNRTLYSFPATSLTYLVLCQKRSGFGLRTHSSERILLPELEH